ncbi:hypothetical protein DAPPUDRAFT_40354 [Daphnia pulex]|uniref:Ceramide transfer protein n=1 Tax=Daphnia pulex TaxID=6669 RepID=E9FT92_DAPPU|nr:hypothetical protein DAPPUDRAFT_40354 [Daphnia pulex]|eukprot:EFX89333.1 hypothetical protein DAPPUDRAFT_40354 [Daphnia pulex]
MNANVAQEISGTLSKWTNYIHGWQDRYIVVKDGVMAYYKSQQDTGYGCRGSVSIRQASIKPHEFDECRYDVCVNDSVWYLRAESPEEKQRWLTFLESHKMEYESNNGHLRRHGSAVSLTSNNFSTASASSFRKGRGLREKLSEMETYRDILIRQVDTLQGFFDACADVVKLSDEILIERGSQAVDFRGEALTFKATTAGVLARLQHCLDLFNQSQDGWRRRLEREVEKRKKVEDLYRQALEELRTESKRIVLVGGPDYQEGPHSTIGEDEFYDAVEAGLDKIDEEQQYLERLKNKQVVRFASQAPAHPLWPEIERVTLEQLQYARLGVEGGVWQLFAEDGEMKMYKREEEVDGLAVDPLKAVHTVKGVTGREMTHYFFSPDVRFEWETTLEQMKVLETIADDTLVILQIHKRVWPASQRDALFWSHVRRVPNDTDRDAQDIWIACNHSTEHHEAPSNEGKMVRVSLTVCLVCQTSIEPPADGGPVTRDHLTCKITYCSVVNPGGWVPTSALRAVYKREYPKFLKRFTQYVKDRCDKQPILF